METTISENLDIQVFDNQVAGHSLLHGKFNVGIVKCSDGCILKPLVKPALAQTEINFYEEVWSSTGNVIGLLKNFIPQYKGLVVRKINEEDVTFLKLQDVSAGLAKPCIADVKMGKQTWEPSACPAKQKTEDAKYRETKTNFGIAITGYQVYNIAAGTFIKRDKTYGKALTKETTPIALKEFVNAGAAGSEAVVSQLLARLRDMLCWWEAQSGLRLYSSSLLLLYDASQLGSQSPQESWVRAYMIDFAHVVHTPEGSKDYNYIHGLRNLIHLISDL